MQSLLYWAQLLHWFLFQWLFLKKQIQKEIAKLQKEAEKINKENFEIKEKITYLESKDYKEREAKDKLNLQSPGEKVVFVKPSVVRKSDNPQENLIENDGETVIENEKSKVSNSEKWWKYFFN